MDLRDRIKSLIDHNPGLTVRSVLLAAGLSDSMLHKFLTNQTDSMNIKTVEKLAAVLNVDPRWLAFGEGGPEVFTDISEKIDRLPDQQRAIVIQLIDQFTGNQKAA